MEQPRFAQHLPSGPFLDWAFGRAVTSGDRTRNKIAPSVGVAITHWDVLDDATAVHIAGTSADVELLEWIAAHAASRGGIRCALMRNSSLPFAVLRQLLEAGSTPAEVDAVVATRSSAELGDLMLGGYGLPASDQQAALWLSAFVARSAAPDVHTQAVARLAAEQHYSFVANLVRHSDDDVVFSIDAVLTTIEGCVPQSIAPNTWRNLGEHLTRRGTLRQIRRALQLTTAASLRTPLLAARRVPIATVMARLSAHDLGQLLSQLPPERLLELDEVEYVTGLTLEATTLHELNCTPEAATWAATNANEAAAGALVWRSDSDSTLIQVLRRNKTSHRWAVAHIWRIGRVWHRLSNQVKHDLVATLDAVSLSALAPGPVRDWIIATGPASCVSGLVLRRTELRALIDRVERTRDADMAWLAARAAERPRDRVRMAEIGMGASSWRDELRQWLRSGQSGEITRLWLLIPELQRIEVSALLVAGLRSGDDTSWLDRLVAELSLDWQHCPVVVQEAAAQWLANHVPANPDVWSGVWSLYAEWSGTLPDLVAVARSV
jgi:hypothetical protein